MTGRLERDLIAASEAVVRVSPKLMADVCDSARIYAKSDPIDALAVARAAVREPDLPVAQLDGVERELRLLIDPREDLVAERTHIICRPALAPARTRSRLDPPSQHGPDQRIQRRRGTPGPLR